MGSPKILKDFADIPVPKVEVGDRVRIREPLCMGNGVVSDIRGKLFCIVLDHTYTGESGKPIKVIMRKRKEIIKIEPR